MLNRERVAYLLAGILNTIFGYAIGVGIFKVFSGQLGIVYIGLISNILSITFSFVSYKLFVFKTKGMWLSEYLKAFVIYSGTAIVSIFFLWVFVDLMKISIWFAQALVIGLTAIISYFGHSRFTFRYR